MNRSDLLRRFATTILSFMIVFAFMPIFGQDAYAATKKSGTPKIISAQVNGNTVILKWSKTNKAKKYKVYVQTGADKWKYWKSVKKNKANKKKYSNKLKYKLKRSGKKYKVYKQKNPYKLIRKTKKRSYIYTGEYGLTYRFVVRAMNGKKAGKFSRAKTVTTAVKSQLRNSQQNSGDEVARTVLPVKASVSGNVISLSWDSAGEGCTYDLSYSRMKEIASIKELGSATSFSIKGVYGTTYYFRVTAHGSEAKNIYYQEVEITIPESSDPTPPTREYVDASSMETKVYLEDYVFPDLYKKYQKYNGTNTDEYTKLKNMKKAIHSLCCYGYADHNRFFKERIIGFGPDPDSEFTPPPHVEYALGCESCTMCMLYLCSKAGLTAYAYYPGHAYPLVKIGGCWLGRSADATYYLSNPGDDEELNLDGYYCKGYYGLNKQFNDANIKDVFSLKALFDLQYPRDKISFNTSISWGGYKADFSGNPKGYTIDIDKCKFKPVEGDTDIITFDNNNRTFSTHGTGMVKIKITCGKWSDIIDLKLSK